MVIKLYGITGGNWQFTIPKYGTKVSRVLKWDASDSNVQDAFKDFGIHGVDCARTLLTATGQDTTDAA